MFIRQEGKHKEFGGALWLNGPPIVKNCSASVSVFILPQQDLPFHVTFQFNIKRHLLNYISHSSTIQSLNWPIFKKIFAQLLKFLLTIDISGKLHFHLGFSGPHCTFMPFYRISYFFINFYEANHELCEATKAIFGCVTFVCT